ncbi:Cysteine Protease [Melia azedarach]|nr:Cysteine Protease [Melia azedarach]
MILATWASQAMSRTLNEASVDEKFEQWIAQHGRTYEDGLEKDRRFNIFKYNLALVEQVNNAGNSEKTYPYEGRDGTCDKEKAEEHAAQITKYEDVASNDEGALLNAVANQPVSVAIDARNLKLYDGGIFDGECGTSLNHGVTVVGYGNKRGR